MGTRSGQKIAHAADTDHGRFRRQAHTESMQEIARSRTSLMASPTKQSPSWLLLSCRVSILIANLVISEPVNLSVGQKFTGERIWAPVSRIHMSSTSRVLIIICYSDIEAGRVSTVCPRGRKIDRLMIGVVPRGQGLLTLLGCSQ